MIPTAFKQQIPRFLSYPVGAQVISTALEGVPHSEDIHLCFHGASFPAEESLRAMREGRPHRILHVRFTPERSPGYSGSNDFVERGWYKPKWELWIYPVLREQKHVANQLLKAVALPVVGDWMRLSTNAGWNLSQHELRFEFRPVEGTLSESRINGA